MTRLEALARLGVAAALALLALRPAAAADDPARAEVTVFAAASMTDVLQEIGAGFRADTGIAIRLSFAASSALARQLELGAPAQVFVSADGEWMDYLANLGFIDPATRRDVAGNELVLVAPAGSELKIAIEPGLRLAAALGGGRLALADPDSVPAGRYARAALTSLGAWKDVESRLVPAENVRAALAYVSRGEVPLGIVYRTDVRVDAKVRVIGAFPAGTHPPIVYPAAAVRGSPRAAAKFVEYLAKAKAQAIFVRHGFTAATQ
jgi:molybdate transport system substrate-binding protein